MRTQLHRPWLGIGMLLLFAAIAAAASWSPLHIATGDSLPKGLYWLCAPSASRGSIALACLPAPTAALGRARGYLRAGSCAGGARPVGKPVAAVAGDRVDHHAAVVAVHHHALVGRDDDPVERLRGPEHQVLHDTLPGPGIRTPGGA